MVCMHVYIYTNCTHTVGILHSHLHTTWPAVIFIHLTIIVFVYRRHLRVTSKLTKTGLMTSWLKWETSGMPIISWLTGSRIVDGNWFPSNACTAVACRIQILLTPFYAFIFPQLGTVSWRTQCPIVSNNWRALSSCISSCTVWRKSWTGSGSESTRPAALTWAQTSPAYRHSLASIRWTKTWFCIHVHTHL